MIFFQGRHMSDGEIWAVIQGIEDRRDKVTEMLAGWEHAAGVESVAELARELHRLNKICLPAAELRECLKDLSELQKELEVGQGGADTAKVEETGEMESLYEEYSEMCRQRAVQVYRLLLEAGYLEYELEDYMDIKILEFIDYAGPEYAWRLGINIGLALEECRQRLEKLLAKGFLERVEGNMLGNYHREKSWTKHMNHTYYRISRVGRLYLRQRRQGE